MKFLSIISFISLFLGVFNQVTAQEVGRVEHVVPHEGTVGKAESGPESGLEQRQRREAAEFKEWKTEWEDFARNPGAAGRWLLGREKGELYSGSTAEERAQTITTAIEGISEVFEEDPAKGIDALKIIVDESNKTSLGLDDGQRASVHADALKELNALTDVLGVQFADDAEGGLKAVKAALAVASDPNLQLTPAQKAAYQAQAFDAVKSLFLKASFSAQAEIPPSGGAMTFPTQIENPHAQQVYDVFLALEQVLKDKGFELTDEQRAELSDVAARRVQREIGLITDDPAAMAEVNDQILPEIASSAPQLADVITQIKEGKTAESVKAITDLEQKPGESPEAFAKRIENVFKAQGAADSALKAAYAEKMDNVAEKVLQGHPFVLAEQAKFLEARRPAEQLNAALSAYQKELEFLDMYINAATTSDFTLKREAIARRQRIQEFLKNKEDYVAKLTPQEKGAFAAAGRSLSGLAKWWRGAPDIVQPDALNILPEDYVAILDEQAQRLSKSLPDAQSAEQLNAQVAELARVVRSLNGTYTVNGKQRSLVSLVPDQGQARAVQEQVGAVLDSLADNQQVKNLEAEFGADRAALLKELTDIAEELRANKAGFEGDAAYKAAEKVLGEFKKGDVAKIASEKEAFGELNKEIEGAGVEGLAGLDEKIAERLKQLEGLGAGLSPEMLQEVRRMEGTLRAWAEVVEVAKVAEEALSSGSGSATVAAFNVRLLEAGSGVREGVDYRVEEVFTTRRSVMDTQAVVLDRLVQVADAQKVDIKMPGDKKSGSVALTKAALAWLEPISLNQHGAIDADVLSVLKGQGLIEEKQVGETTRIELTDKGTNLLEVARTQRAIEVRREQLQKFPRKETQLESTKSKSGVENAVAKELNLPGLIWDDRVEALKEKYVATFGTEQGDEFAKLLSALKGQKGVVREVKPLRQQLVLEDMHTYLTERADALGKSGSDQTIKRVVDIRNQLNDPSLTEETRQKLIKQLDMEMTKIKVGDPVSILTLNPKTLFNESVRLVQELGILTGEGINAVLLQSQLAVLDLRNLIANIGEGGALPLGMVGAFVGIKWALGAGAPVIGTTLGFALGGPAAAIAGAAIGGIAGLAMPYVISTVGSLFVGFVLARLTNFIRPDAAEWERFNAKMVAAGYEPVLDKEQRVGLFAATMAVDWDNFSKALTPKIDSWTASFGLGEWFSTTEKEQARKLALNQAQYDTARKNFLSLLGFEGEAAKTATVDDIQKALAAKQKQLSESTSPGAALERRRLINAYNLLEKMSANTVDAHLDSMRAKVGAALAVLGEAQKKPISPSKTEELSRQLDAYFNDFVETQKRLEALQADLEKRREMIVDASAFKDDSLVTVSSGLLEQALKVREQNMMSVVDQMNKELGINVEWQKVAAK